jgi:hypothetical protein
MLIPFWKRFTGGLLRLARIEFSVPVEDKIDAIESGCRRTDHRLQLRKLPPKPFRAGAGRGPAGPVPQLRPCREDCRSGRTRV